MVAPSHLRVGPVHRSTDGVPGRGRRSSAIAVSLALGACVPSGHLVQEQATSPTFDPIAFFAGTTEGNGRLKIMTKRRQQVMVTGHGLVTSDGEIVLDQDVRRGNARSSHRTWHLRRVGEGLYAGTLSDATGPVTGKVTGNLLHLAFPMKSGLRAQQWLYLQPGGQISRNRMVVTKFGLPVASLDETIKRMPA
jgi:hypothetical protein